MSDNTDQAIFARLGLGEDAEIGEIVDHCCTYINDDSNLCDYAACVDDDAFDGYDYTKCPIFQLLTAIDARARREATREERERCAEIAEAEMALCQGEIDSAEHDTDKGAAKWARVSARCILRDIRAEDGGEGEG